MGGDFGAGGDRGLTAAEVSARRYTSFDPNLAALEQALNDHYRVNVELIEFLEGIGGATISVAGERLVEFDPRTDLDVVTLGRAGHGSYLTVPIDDGNFLPLIREIRFDELAAEQTAFCAALPPPALVPGLAATIGPLCATPLPNIDPGLVFGIGQLIAELGYDFPGGGVEARWRAPLATETPNVATLAIAFRPGGEFVPSGAAPLINLNIRQPPTIEMALQAVPCSPGPPACPGITSGLPACRQGQGLNQALGYLDRADGPFPSAQSAGVDVTLQVRTLDNGDVQATLPEFCSTLSTIPIPIVRERLIRRCFALRRQLETAIETTVEVQLAGALTALVQGPGPLLAGTGPLPVVFPGGGPLPFRPNGSTLTAPLTPPPTFLPDVFTAVSIARGTQPPSTFNIPPSPQLHNLLDGSPSLARESRRLFVEPLLDEFGGGAQIIATQSAASVGSFSFIIDSDGDLLDDAVDTCPGVCNPDLDGDGRGDVGPDSDGDGIPDACDLCPGLASPDNTDSDGDGIGGPCDCDRDGDTCADSMAPLGGPGGGACSFPAGTVLDENPTRPSPLECPFVLGEPVDCTSVDADGDGTFDGVDQDGDGLISDCDPDDDGDGFLDRIVDGERSLPCSPISDPSDPCSDNCLFTPNPDQADDDDDGRGDACDPLEIAAPGGGGPVGGGVIGPLPGSLTDDACLGGPFDCRALPNLDPRCLWDDSCSGEGDAILVTDTGGVPLFRRTGTELSLRGVGPAITTISDVDGDGIEELVVGSPRSDACAAGPCVAGAGEAVAIGSFDGTVLWRLHGTVAGAGFGSAVLRVDDWLYVGAPGAPSGDRAGAGRVHAYRLTGGRPMFAFGVGGEQAGDEFGHTLSLGLDLDGDEQQDVLVGAPGASSPAGSGAGQIVALGAGGQRIVAFDGPVAGGRMGGALSAVLPQVQGPGGVVAGIPLANGGDGLLAFFSWDGTLAYSRSGSSGEALGASVSAATDYDEDGFDELAIGAPGANGGVGRVLIVDTFFAVLDTLVATDGSGFGFQTAAPGDVTGDGAPDLLVSFRELGSGPAVITFAGLGGTPMDEVPFP